jgi:ABC-2 type transport system ATP-binding protein
MIELKRLRKVFGERVAVEGIDLSVKRGEIFGLLGHNGAGKSTCIGMMLGQVWPTDGEVFVCGHDVTQYRRKALEKVGAIFEAPVFYDYLSGYRNLEILSHYTAKTSPERLREVIEWVGLTGREKSAVKTYSHGMRTRLALAQALLPNPELLILDEPSDGLDPEGIHEMRQTILRLQKELGLTILLSSHLLNEVEQLCTRIAVIQKGRKVFEGTLRDVRGERSWVRLKTSEPERMRAQLKHMRMIAEERDGDLFALAEGVTSDQLAECLVERGFRIYELACHQATLEDFYLSLVKSGGKHN